LTEIFREEKKTIEMKKRCVAIMEDNDTKNYMKSILNQLDKEIRNEFKNHGPTTVFEYYLNKLRIWDPKFYDSKFYL
jgi:hypothetical protein